MGMLGAIKRWFGVEGKEESIENVEHELIVEDESTENKDECIEEILSNIDSELDKSDDNIEKIEDKSQRISLTDREWKEYRLGDLYDVVKVKKYNYDKLPKNGDCEQILFKDIGRKNSNGELGYVDYSDEYDIAPAGTISVTNLPGANNCIQARYNDEPFIAGVNTTVIINKSASCIGDSLFVCSCITNYSLGKFSRNHSATGDRLLEFKLKLPKRLDSEEPDYEFMRKYIKSREPDYSYIKDSKESKKLSLDGVKFGKFKVSDLFEISRGKHTINSIDRISGDTPYFGAFNNRYSVTSYVGNDLGDKQEDCIVASCFGAAMYIEEAFYSDCNTRVLKSKYKEMSKYCKIFISNIIDSHKSLFNYSLKLNPSNLSNMVIEIPVDEAGNPDWDFMDRYIKGLPYSVSI